MHALHTHAAAFLTSFDPALAATAAALARMGVPEVLPKGQALLAAGEVAARFYFLHRGVIRNYLPREGPHARAGVTTWLTVDTDFVSAFGSLTTQTPSREAVEALEACEVLTFAGADLQRAYAELAGAERLGRLIVEHYFAAMTARLYENAVGSARERYERLLEYRPEILQRVPLGIVAGFLGTSAEHLSRIRRKVSEGGGK